jgi:hypothetical protein
LLGLADRLTESVAVLGQLAQEAEQAERWVAAGTAHGNRSVALMYLGRTEAGRRAVEAGLACYGRTTLDQSALLLDQMNLAGFLRDEGRFSSYLDMAEPLPAGLHNAGYPLWSVNAENDLALTYCWLGRPDLAYRIIHRQLAPDTSPLALAVRLLTKATLARDHGVRLHDGERHRDLTHQGAAVLREEGALGRPYLRMKIDLECARADGPTADPARLASIEQEAEQREQYMLLAQVRLLRLQRTLSLPGDKAEAATLASLLEAQCERDGMPPGLYPPLVWWTLAQACCDGDAQHSAALVERARTWIESTATHRVPRVFQQTFREGNPVNRLVLGGSSPSRRQG